MISEAGYHRACHVIDTGHVAELLEQAIRTDRRGRKRALPIRVFLVGAMLAASRGSLTIEDIHTTLTEELPLALQRDLGVLRTTVDPQTGDEAETPFPISRLYSLSRTITAKLSHGATSAPKLNPDQRARRAAALQQVVDALIDATVPDIAGASYALDATGVWAWAIGRKATAGKKRADTNTTTADDGRKHRRRRPNGPDDLDARWGIKTGKDGKDQPYFGYEIHTVVSVPDIGHDPAHRPALVHAMTVTPASTDVVEPSLRLLDHLADTGRPVRDLAVDRHYSYKAYDRWAAQLTRRGIHQVLDLRSDEHGWHDYNGARIVDGWPHCPATPDKLGVIQRPGPGAKPAQVKEFAAKIQLRQRYAMRRVAGPDDTGKTRWECPAIAGTIGCPLREGSEQVARELGLPIVQNPPREHAPKCCTQRTTLIPPGEHMKHAQDDYWGSAAWKHSFDRRTYVEGIYGNLKNPSTENVRRGHFRVMGLPLVTLLLAIAVAACNLRQLRNWYNRTGNQAAPDPCGPGTAASALSIADNPRPKAA